jgi:hypothetical protein
MASAQQNVARCASRRYEIGPDGAGAVADGDCPASGLDGLPAHARRESPSGKDHMKQTIAVAAILSLAFPAWPAETIAAPPPPPDDLSQEQPRPPAPASEMGYFESCFGVPRVGAGPFSIYGEVPIPIGGQSTGTSPSPPAVSGSKDGKVWLVVAVVAAMALPVVVYVVDKPAPRLVLQRFRCPTFSLDVLGGADNSVALRNGAYGFVSTRFTFGVGNLATDLQYDAAPGAVSAFSTHLLLRPTPREHIEGGLAIGYRRSVLAGRIQEGLEVGIPHRYALWRDGLRTLALELRPLLLVSSRLEPSLETAFLFPLAQVLHLRVGGRVFTFEGDLRWGLSAGLSLTL